MYKEKESGRSMVEMLGVLAIIGVLSVAGIAGYTTAMNKHQANQILNEASVRAIVVSTQIQRGATTPTLGEFTDNEVGGAKFGTEVKNASGTADWTTTDKRFSLTLTGVDEKICDQMKATVGQNSIIKAIADDCTTITYNNDLSTTTSMTDHKDSTSCESAGGVWNNTTKTCGCPGRYTGSNCEVAPTSCPSGTTTTEDGKCKWCSPDDFYASKGYRSCITCSVEDEGICADECTCYDPRTETAMCDYYRHCQVCAKPRTPIYDCDQFICFNPDTDTYACSSSGAVMCTKPEIAGCGSSYGVTSCICYNPETQNYGCSYDRCITCIKPNIPVFDGYSVLYTCYNPETTSAACSPVECKKCNKPEEAKCSESGYCTCYNPHTQNVICTEAICKACDKDSDTPQPYCDDVEMECSCRAE